jgi:hypothetical protein
VGVSVVAVGLFSFVALAPAAPLQPNSRPAADFAQQLERFSSKPSVRKFDGPTRASVDATVSQLEAKARAARLSPSRSARPARSVSVDRSGAGVRRRARSAVRFRGLSAGSAWALTEDRFGAEVRQGSETPDLSGVISFRGSHVAVQRPVNGKQELLVSPMPLGASSDGGALAPIDLTLGRTPDGWSPVNSVVESALPAQADGAVRAADGLSFGLDGAAASPGTRTDDAAVFYAGTQRDTDTTVVPTQSGVETFFTLRSKAAPESFRLDFSGSQLVADAGGVRVLRGGHIVGSVAAPHAVDAAGVDVPVDLRIDGDTVIVQAPHQDRAVEYPILVDPVVEALSTEPSSVKFLQDYFGPGGDLYSMAPEDRDEWYFLSDDPAGPGTAALTGSEGPGLYVTRPAGQASNTLGWAYVLPNSARVSQVDFGPYSVDRGADNAGDDVLMMAAGGDGYVWGDVALANEHDATLTAESTGGVVSVVMFVLLPVVDASTFGSDHEANLRGVVLHVLADDAPTITSVSHAGDQSLGTVTWTNTAETVPTSISAASVGSGVQELAVVARDEFGDETLLGHYVEACDGSLEAPCPATLTHDVDVDYSLIPEGRYTLRVRALDPFDNESEDSFVHIGIDRTPPSLPDVDATLVTDAAGEPVIHVDVPQIDPGDASVSSGVSATGVSDDEDTGASVTATTNCVSDDCDPPVTVPLHDDAVVDQEITVKAQDLAGNEASTTTHLTTQAWAPLDQDGGDNDNGTITGGGGVGGGD